MKMVQKIQKIFQLNKYLISLFFGFLIVSYSIYVRIILKRVPKQITDTLPNETKIMFIFLFLLFSYLLIINLYKYLVNNEYYKPKKSGILKRFSQTSLWHYFGNIFDHW